MTTVSEPVSLARRSLRRASRRVRQLVLADPSENFFPAFKRERHGGERDFGMLLNDLITIVAINKGVTPNDQRRDQLALFQDIFFKLFKFNRIEKEVDAGCY